MKKYLALSILILSLSLALIGCKKAEEAQMPAEPAMEQPAAAPAETPAEQPAAPAEAPAEPAK